MLSLSLSLLSLLSIARYTNTYIDRYAEKIEGYIGVYISVSVSLFEINVKNLCTYVWK